MSLAGIMGTVCPGLGVGADRRWDTILKTFSIAPVTWSCSSVPPGCLCSLTLLPASYTVGPQRSKGPGVGQIMAW